MIQSDKFDSSIMDIKKIINSVFIFTIKRLIEILGIIIICVGILLLFALISYSPTDPNFIFPENTEIKNLLGFHGSYTSDLFIQSIGLISYLIPVSYIFTGLNIFRKKDIFLFIENTFFIILYILTGSLFFDYFYENTFSLYITGNGGFVGNYLSGFFFKNFNSSYENLIYYFILITVVILFLFSINFEIKNLNKFIKKLFKLFYKKNSKNYTNKNEIINEYIPQDGSKI